MALVCKADLDGHISERKIGFGEQGLGSLDSKLVDVLSRGEARRSLELPMKVERAQVDDRSKPREGDRSIEVRFDELDRPS